jgi:hypothetical protein
MTAQRGRASAPGPIWLVKTDMGSFIRVERDPGDDSAFAHWLAAGRLYVTPDPNNPRKYGAALERMQPGDSVVAYEDEAGIVAVGRVSNDMDLRSGRADAERVLYPNDAEIVLSIAVNWDSAVRRTAAQVSQAGHVMAGHALRSYVRPTKLRSYLLRLVQEAQHQRVDDPDLREAETLAQLRRNTGLDVRQRAQLVQARVGQGIFSATVLAREPACRLTGVSLPSCLVASHIKPWAVCAKGEHLDGANALMLAPHVDHLFDTGLISFEDNGDLVLAPSLNLQILQAWHIDPRANVGPFAPDQARYLAYHRQHVFGQPRPRRQRNMVGDAPADIAAFDDLLAPGLMTAGGRR